MSSTVPKGKLQLVSSAAQFAEPPSFAHHLAPLPYVITPSVMAAYDALERWLYDPSVGLALVSGPAGIGKTRFLSSFLEHFCAAPQNHEGAMIQFRPLFASADSLQDVVSTEGLAQHIDLLTHQAKLQLKQHVDAVSSGEQDSEARPCDASKQNSAAPSMVRDWYMLVVDNAGQLPVETLDLLVFNSLMQRPQVCLTILADGPVLLERVREQIAQIQHLRRQLQVLDVPAFERAESDNFIRSASSAWGLRTQWSESRLRAAFVESLGMPGQLMAILQRAAADDSAGLNVARNALADNEFVGTDHADEHDPEPLRLVAANPAQSIEGEEGAVLMRGTGKPILRFSRQWAWWLIVSGLLLGFVFSVWLLLGQLGVVKQSVALDVDVDLQSVHSFVGPSLLMDSSVNRQVALEIIPSLSISNMGPHAFMALNEYSQLLLNLYSKFTFLVDGAAPVLRSVVNAEAESVAESAVSFNAVYDLPAAIKILFEWSPTHYVVQVDSDIELHQLQLRMRALVSARAQASEMQPLILPVNHRGRTRWLMVLGPYPNVPTFRAEHSEYSHYLLAATERVSVQSWVRLVRDLQQAVLRQRQFSLPASGSST